VPELGFVLYIIAMSYGLGMLWYTLLGRNYMGWMRLGAFPLLGLVIGEGLWAKYLSDNIGPGLVFMGLHLYVALVSTFIAALVDVVFSWLAQESPIANMVKPFGHTQQPTQR